MLRALPLAFGLALSLAAGSASATIQLAGTVTRELQRDNNTFAFYISKSDCEAGANDEFTFTFTFTTADVAAQKKLEVWASDTSDCLTNMDRNGASPKCKKVFDSGTVNAQQVTIELPSQQIALGLNGITVEGGECKDVTGQANARPVNLVFLYLTSTNEDATEYVKFPTANYNIAVDLIGPPAPESITVSAAEQALSVTVDDTTPPTDLARYYIYCDPPPSGPSDDSGGCACINAGDTGGAAGSDGSTTTKTTTTGTTVAGPPPPATGGMGGVGGMGGMAGGTGGMAGGMGGMAGGMGGMAGGTGGMAGGMAGTGGATGGVAGTAGSGGDDTCISNLTAPSGDNPGVCKSCVLTQGGAVPDEIHKCGEIPISGSGIAGVLENGEYYAVAVAAVDQIGNVGPLTAVTCGEPVPVKDFYEKYRESGGQGGGGCSVQARPRRSTLFVTAPAAMAIAGLALALRRRRKTASGSSSTRGGAR